MKNQFKEKKGITLIALVITIIVLLILAGVTIATLTGDNGLLTKAGNAKNTNENAEIEEEIILAWNKVYTDSYLNNYTPAEKASALQTELGKNGYTATLENLTVTYRKKEIVIDETTGKMEIKQPLPEITAGQKAPSDSNAKYTDGKYTAVIPAGFTVSNVAGESSIETGLVIRDDAGNEFVWIPVGIPYKSNSSKTIELSRYTFDDDGNPTKQEANAIEDDFGVFTEDIKNNTGKGPDGNAIANDIEDFKLKTNAAGGFWIGRYEARIEDYDSVDTNCPWNDPNWVGYTGGKLVEKPNTQVFNYITQNKAAELSRVMYTSSYFESDLINSYAWDTATLFLQEYDDRTESNLKKYSIQEALGTGLSSTGLISDKICNVYDMASNCVEWATETFSGSNPPCVLRGESWGQIDGVRARGCGNAFVAVAWISFRTILYVK